MRNAMLVFTLLSLCLAAPAWADDPPPAPEIPNRCDLDCFRGLVHAYAEERDVTIPRAAVIQRFQEADANRNGTLGRQERIRLAHALPNFFAAQAITNNPATSGFVMQDGTGDTLSVDDAPSVDSSESDNPATSGFVMQDGTGDTLSVDDAPSVDAAESD